MDSTAQPLLTAGTVPSPVHLSLTAAGAASTRPCGTNAPKVRFSATVGQEPEVELAL